MRTTVDLPPALHRRAREIAASRHESLSTVLADLAARGLASMDVPASIDHHPVSGFPRVSIGRTVTADDVAALLDDDE
ncbi:hypothetical protein [Microbacterium marinilacus]|uniref:Antitoxin VapB29 n=1 Tax=Microbacterium marinilacus TaxID=415209 RepID=A0ABP7BN51_9MICO|nr:hypothetical protein [Microbacterium marinilacus]MBY0689663.1 hypothetical protein [Microbacterium marinilacus]